MKLLLINPPNNRFDRTYLAPPLGLLTLAAAARRGGHQASVLDLNLETFSDPGLDGEQFYDRACRMIAAEGPDVVGFTSMCLESHVSLELARRTKGALPRAFTVLGGTHFGAIAREALENFPFVDFVIRGEAEQALVELLDRGMEGGPPLPANVFYRGGASVLQGLVDREPPALEDLPFPAYDLVDLRRYFALNPARLLNYEAGRGCVFKCSFCYSPFHYGDAVRNKRPEQVVEDLRRLSDLGARHVFFVQDNLLNSPRWAAELCRQLIAAALPLTWECYVTYPQLKGDLVDLLAEAGCRGVFTGIDAVAAESQVRLNKPFLRDWEATARKLARCLERGVQPLCAFILEEPEQDGRKNELTISAALRCVEMGCEIHLNTLTRYNGSPLSRAERPARLSYTSAKVELLMDAPEVVRRNEFAERLPQLFPYHATAGDPGLWAVFAAKVHTLSSLVSGLRRTLLRHVVEEGNSIWGALGYIDEPFFERLRALEPAARREAAVLEFHRHFASQEISAETRTLLGREVAVMLLSRNHAAHALSLSVDSTTRPYRLAPFIDIARRPEGARRRAADDSHLAFLSRDRNVKIFSAPPEFVKLLRRLERAAASRESVRLSSAEVERLEDEGWIWAEPDERPPRFP